MGVKVGTVKGYAVAVAQASAELLIAVGLSTTQVKVAMGGIDSVAQFAKH